MIDKTITTRRVVLLLQFTAFSFTLLGLKFWLIHTYGNETPFWDQWDAEAKNLYDPFLNGKLQWADLFSAHNEHRIFATRILGLILLKANGLWSPLLEMVTNAILHVFTLSITVWLLSKVTGGKFTSALLLFALFAFGVPYAWENTLSGFQSQFYFVLLFSVISIWLLTTHPPFKPWWYVGFASAIAAYFSLASGVFAVAAVATTILFRYIFITRDRRELLAVILLSILFVLGVLGTPSIAGHSALRAANPHQFLSSFLKALAWPTGAWLLAIIRNLPLIILIGTISFKKFPPNNPIWFIFSLGIWLVGQAAGIAFGRSGDVLSSRYLDLYALGLLANFAAVIVIIDSAKKARKLPYYIAGFLWFTLVSIPLIKMATNKLPNELTQKHASSALQESNLTAYLLSSDLPTLRNVPIFESPYPAADRLASIVDTPAIRNILPRNLQSPISMVSMEQSESNAFIPGGSYATTPSCNCSSWGSYGPEGDKAIGTTEMRYRTPSLEGENYFFEIKIAGYPLKAGSIEVIQENETKLLIPHKDPGESWSSLQFSVKPGLFNLKITDRSPNSWIAIGNPIKIGRIDQATSNILKMWSYFISLGIALACLIFCTKAHGINRTKK